MFLRIAENRCELMK